MWWYGAVQEGTNISDAVKFVLPLPPLWEQEDIVGHLTRGIGNVRSLSGKVEASIERLREYRHALIAAAVTGKLDVSQAEFQTEPVLEPVAESA